MATMNVSLPEALKDWAEGQSRTGVYSNTSDYVRDLIRKDKERSEKITAMRRLIEEAEASGVSENTMADILASARKAAGVKREL